MGNDENARHFQSASNALLGEPRFGEWQPMRSAPKDGTVILARLPGSPDMAYVIVWVDGQAGIRAHMGKRKLGWCISWDGYVLPAHDQPTHWMPLPLPPNAALSGGEAVRSEG